MTKIAPQHYMAIKSEEIPWRQAWTNNLNSQAQSRVPLISILTGASGLVHRVKSFL